MLFKYTSGESSCNIVFSPTKYDIHGEGNLESELFLWCRSRALQRKG